MCMKKWLISIYIKNVIPDGAGALYERYELFKEAMMKAYFWHHTSQHPSLCVNGWYSDCTYRAVLQDIRNVSMRPIHTLN